MTKAADIVWSPVQTISIPNNADIKTIVGYGATLSERDRKAIVQGMRAESYEMVSAYVWGKAVSALKHQVSNLGMEFVGEMLGRPDLDDDSDPTSSIGDHEAIALAEDLGMITSTQALRLKHAMELVRHFSGHSAEDSMQKDEASSLIRTCIQSILGTPVFDSAIRFADFREKLLSTAVQAGDPEVEQIKNAPYFFVRTTLSVLLSSLRTTHGASLEHTAANTVTLVPILWEDLREPEKWQVGQVYAELNSAGNRIGSAALKLSLLGVRGFDFVPESLRSKTFTECAARVLAAHFAYNNFYNEPEPMEALANLGTSIPRPAFAKVMEATLAVRLGNRWNRAREAQEAAKRLLGLVRTQQWTYYLNECLPRDRTILDKLSDEDKPIERWKELRADFPELVATKPRDPSTERLLRETDLNSIKRSAKLLRERAGN